MMCAGYRRPTRQYSDVQSAKAVQPTNGDADAALIIYPSQVTRALKGNF